MVEFTLLNLREDLKGIVSRNDQLEIQNATIQRDINDLIRLLESLAVQKSQLSGRPVSFYFPKDQAQSGSLIDIRERERRTEDLISHLEADNLKLKEEIRVLEQKLLGQEYEVKRRLLLNNMESRRQNLLKMERKIDQLRKASAGPLSAIEELEQEKKRLMQQIREIEQSPYRY